MMNFFESVINFFQMIGQAITNFFDSLLGFFEVLLMSLALPPMLASLLPEVIYASAIIFVGITVIRKICGR